MNVPPVPVPPPPIPMESVPPVPRLPVPLLSVRGLSVAFDGNRVVDQLSFDVFPGECFALVGESGSGKSVTAQTILQLLPDAEIHGSVRLAAPSAAADDIAMGSGAPRPGTGGSGVADAAPLELIGASTALLRQVRGRRIAMVFQEPMSALNPLYSVGDQIAEVLTVQLGMTRPQATARAVELLDRTGVREPGLRARRLPHQLSGGERQRAMIAMALAAEPEMIIADEPTTALDAVIRGQIMELLDRVRHESGMALLLITHDLLLVRDHADRVGVMRYGRLVEGGPVDVVFRWPRQPYTRQLLASHPRPLQREAVDALPRLDAVAEADDRAPALRVTGLSCTWVTRVGWFGRREHRAIEDVSFTLMPGRTIGIVGESGSGKTTLAMSVLRLSQARLAGTVELDGERIDAMPMRALRPLRRRLQVVFQDPYNALSPRMTVGRFVGEGLELHEPQMTPDERERRVGEALRDVGLSKSFAERYPQELSGGQRQRVAIARAVILRPRCIVLDEPTSALDVSVQQQVLTLLLELQQRHDMAYLLITHDLGVVRALADTMLVLKDGRVAEEGRVEDILAQPAHPYTKTLLAGIRRVGPPPALPAPPA